MFHARSLALKLILWICAATLLIVAVPFWYNHRVSRQIVRAHAAENAANIAEAAASRIGVVLRGAEKVAQGTAGFVAQRELDREALERLIRATVRANPEAYGMGVSFEPRAFAPAVDRFAPYVHKKAGTADGLGFLLLNDAYDYTEQAWYVEPKARGVPVWSEPYFDKGAGNVLMTTYSVPVYRDSGGGKRLLAVVTIDIALDWLEPIVSPIRVFRNGYGFLISAQGRFLTYPTKSFIMARTIFDVADERSDADLRDVGRRMVSGETGFRPHRSVVTGRDGFIYFMPLAQTGWSIGIVCPEDELMADLHRLNRIMFFLGFAGFAILLVVIILIAGTITRPLRRLAQAASRIGEGNLEGQVPLVRSRDEVGDLAGVLARMQASLRGYVESLTETTAAKERIESELQIARDIQRGILSTHFPEHAGLGLYAVVEPAREVGGDLYDFFWIDRTRLCFAIGDVSDKGVAAALFMAVTKTLHKILALEGRGPAEVVAAANRELSSENAASMFVTLFSGRIDLETGAVRYCNAGHNPPLVLRRAGGVTVLRGPGGPAVGVVDGAAYREDVLRLAPGDSLLLYTDGVTEAMNEDGAMYGEPRLVALAGSLAGRSAREIVAAVRADVTAFAAGASQADDIAILALCYGGAVSGSAATSGAGGETLRVENRIDELPRLQAFVERCGPRFGLSPDGSGQLMLALEELFTNVIRHGYDDAGLHEIEFRLRREGDHVVATVEDDGRPFDPLAQAAPDTTLPSEQRSPGGLGIHLVRSVMDGVAYERRGAWNVLVLRKRVG